MDRPAAAAVDPPYAAPAYRSTALRAPTKALVPLAAGATERSGPRFGDLRVDPAEADLTRGHGAAPLGERIVVGGQLLDGDGRPIRHQLVELWQANAAGRYAHEADQHDAPLDPHFTGAGRALTDDEGRWSFTTVKPGAYPWGNHPNAWRPAHLHLSVFGRCFTERLVTQAYFPGDPLLAFDPILHSIRDERARARLVATFDWGTTTEGWALGYRFDIVVGGHLATPLDPDEA